MPTNSSDEERNRISDGVLMELSQRHSEQDAITMAELFVKVTGDHIIPMRKYDQTRIIRSVIKQLREEGQPIADCSSGYYMADSTAALQPTIDKFHHRAMSSLRTEAALKKIQPGSLIKQYELEITETEGHQTDE